MNYFVKTLGKPSTAIQAMFDGLHAQDDRPGFEIQMTTFGYEAAGICYGCAATCTVQQVMGINFTPEEVERHTNIFKGIESDDVATFEGALDKLRKGEPYKLLELFSVCSSGLASRQDWYLTSRDWKEALPKVEAYRDRLIAAGH